MPKSPWILVSLAGLALAAAVGCGDDDDGGGTDADRIGVGAMCTANADCLQGGDAAIVQQCLQQFRGGYCGLTGCTGNVDCPYGSACVAHTDGQNYCFRICLDKGECNLNRTPDVESNCSANIDFVDGRQGSKACVPPSSG